MKTFDRHLQALAAALLGLGLAASVSAANGSAHHTRTSSEYNEAVKQAYKDYESANRRCEVLGIDERILCRRDSLAARRTAIEKAQVQRNPSLPAVGGPR
jgi:hypothetical protein